MTQVTLLLPELRRIVPFSCAPIVARWVSRGDTQAAPRGRDNTVRECFEFVADGIPDAALTRQLDGGNAGENVWINADPAYVIADAVTVRTLAVGSIDIDAAERAEFLRALRPLFGDTGFPLEVSPSGRWQLRGPREAQLPSFAHPHNVLGDDMVAHLPMGTNERQWRHLLNEAQVILHNHPVNAQRTARGQVPVNSIWFWGAGTLPAWVKSRMSAFASSDPVIAALAKMSNVASFDPLSADAFKRDDERSVLVDADDADRLADFVERIDAAIDGGKIDSVRVLSNDGSRVSYRRAHRWRFWRSIKPLQTT